MRNQSLVWRTRTLGLSLSIALLMLQSTGSRSAPQPESTKSSKLTVVVGAAVSLQMLSGVHVSIIGPEKGVRRLGQTTELGRIELDKTLIREEPRGVIVLCHEGFFCGAIMAEDVIPDRVEERLIHLAPFAVS